MKPKSDISRQKFVSNSALESIVILGATGMITSCARPDNKNDKLLVQDNSCSTINCNVLQDVDS